jgi:hypothetical protein
VLILEDYFRTELTPELIQKMYQIVASKIEIVEERLKELNFHSPKHIKHDDFKEV